jgi:hypothetical protein
MSKRFLATTLVLAFIMTAPFASAKTAAADATKAPRLTLVEPLKDFGTVPKGQKLDWVFEYRNTGTADLQILAAKPTCGCTVADFDKVIKPGQTGKVTAHVDTTAFAGPISKAVILETNDPAAPTAQVTISAMVKPYVDAYPVGYVRYNMLQGDAVKQSVLLYSEDEAPFEILKVNSPQEWIRAEIRKAEGADAVPTLGRNGQVQYILDVTVGGDRARIGPIAEKVHVSTNSRFQPDFWLTVTGVIRPAFRVEPGPDSGVNFGEVSAANGASVQTILLRSNNLTAPESFVVTKAESGVAGIKTAVKPTGNKGEYEVTLEVPRDAKPGSLDGSILIHTSDTVHPVVTIPVRGTVKSATR